MKPLIAISVVLLIGLNWAQAQGFGARGGERRGQQGARLQAAASTSTTDAVQQPMRQRQRDPNNCPLLMNPTSQSTQGGMRFAPRCGRLLCGQGLGPSGCLWRTSDSTSTPTSVACPRCGRVAPGGGRHGGWRAEN
jgi:hypothetical protein